MNSSPLRYPGGKAKIAPFIKMLIANTGNNHPVYIEPFAGGAGVAIELLLKDEVEEIVINDYDKAIYSFWRAVIKESDKLLDLIEKTPVNIEEWKKQKEIYLNESHKYSLDLAFATFFLNRTNRSGILKAGPIGGFDQTGNYLIDARYNKQELIQRIEKICSKKKRIKVTNKEVISFIDNVIPKYENGFVYFDPPYFHKGPELYKNFFVEKDHQVLARKIIDEVCCDWIVTYDYTDKIVQLYEAFETKKFDLNYSVVNGRKKSEILVLKDAKYINETVMKLNKINLRDLGDD